ncbi:MAG: AAA family ATPase [Hyphomicrobiaceae bacterium]|nr:MAG: AAA family ATPase [Hyphomicrobiaceae bacterium]
METEWLEAKLQEAFPQGIYHRGEKRHGIPETPVSDAPKASQPVPAGAGFNTAISQAPNNEAAALLALKTLLGAGNATVSPEQVREIVRKELEGLVLPVTVQLRTDAGETRKLDGLHHRRFPDLLAKVQAGVNVWLAGPAGTGKTTGAQNVAKALGLPFYFNGAIDNEYKLLGFTDAQGRVVSRPFREAFIKGGVYLFDEVDASMQAALLAFNAALANGHCDFPDGCFEKHKDFRCIAAANTYGQGATADYVGRAKQDAAFLDRFVFQSWEIDETLERALAGNDKWVTYVQDVRKRVQAKGIKLVISPRASMNGARMLAAGIHWDECATACLRKGMTDEQWAGVRG